MKLHLLVFCLLACSALGQRVRQAEHQHEAHDGESHDHLNHIQDYRKETVFVHNLPAPELIPGIGTSELQIKTASPQTQRFFSQGVSLLHCFWDFEAYRAFKEAIRHDSTAIMPYWGLCSAIGSIEGTDFEADKKLAIRKLKALKNVASDHEKLYAEGILVRDADSENGKSGYQKKLELIIHKYPEDVDAKLFLALSKMGGYDAAMNPREGQLYSEYLLRDLLKTHPNNAAVHHYWIHLMENCCPERALKSSELLPKLAPASGHMVHMPGHIYYKVGDYKKAYDAFTASLAVDSAYMKKQHIPEVDAWNYIHNINYLLSNCAEDGRYATALYYAEKLKNMPATKERKQKYEGRFFYQGVIAPVKMELCFGFYDKAATRLAAIQLDKDSLYSTKAMAYKDGLFYFASGMDAVRKNKLGEAKKQADALDASLWRNSNQLSLDEVISTRRISDLNVASLELQGVIKSAENRYAEAIALLEKAKKKEDELGYSEPPTYARPVLISLAEAHLKAGKYDKAIAAYTALLERHPNSANAYWGLYTVYKQKGDLTKANDYATRVKAITQHGDKYLFPL
ncbi:tetratricopeptide repeat protein [Spirosoma endophyticum]|uniref:Tetratricopeptide repeat-containing protein n=1 Tax=Spirosoma endophyticum TaxID=662367 RepID=A0A1I2ALQ4_9BACT|nr:tetratricopeptide repeat protein [Spirosoma endophyticum]SFE44934.1 Tetratricopeptide repeat-containing protein [Spirosoma endophyticum]